MGKDCRRPLREMYLSVAKVEYVGPVRRRRLKQMRAEECLRTHDAGCACWRAPAGVKGAGPA